MSRVAKTAIIVPVDVNIKIDRQIIIVNGKNGQLTRVLHKAVVVKFEDNTLVFNPKSGYPDAWIQAGTSRALVNSMIIGVTKGFTKRLQLIGIGYRITIKNNKITIFLGFSHPINYLIPDGIYVECPSNTEILLRGADKQMVGQVAADLYSYRRPEPYNGKGVRYVGEIVRIKNAKKSK